MMRRDINFMFDIILFILLISILQFYFNEYYLIIF